MIDLNIGTTVQFRPGNVERAEEATARKALFKIAGLIRRRMRQSIRRTQKPRGKKNPADNYRHTAGAGKPPTTRPDTGNLKNSIAFDVDVRRRSAWIGPRERITGTIGEVHEFGKTVSGNKHKSRGRRTYPERRFAEPAQTKAWEDPRTMELWNLGNNNFGSTVE